MKKPLRYLNEKKWTILVLLLINIVVIILSKLLFYLFWKSVVYILLIVMDYLITEIVFIFDEENFSRRLTVKFLQYSKYGALFLFTYSLLGFLNIFIWQTDNYISWIGIIISVMIGVLIFAGYECIPNDKKISTA